MTATERLNQHLEDVERRRIALFFNVQDTAGKSNGRMYVYYVVISGLSLAVLLIGQLIPNADKFFVFWSGIFATIAMIISLTEYLYVIDKISSKLYENICSIYRIYDDEFYVLKKFNAGEIEEDVIRQFYMEKSKELKRYNCGVAKPTWVVWINLSIFITSVVLLILA